MLIKTTYGDKKMKYNKKEYNNKEYWKDASNGYCDACGNCVEEDNNSHCDRCNQEYEDACNEEVA